MNDARHTSPTSLTEMTFGGALQSEVCTFPGQTHGRDLALPISQ